MNYINLVLIFPPSSMKTILVSQLQTLHQVRFNGYVCIMFIDIVKPTMFWTSLTS